MSNIQKGSAGIWEEFARKRDKVELLFKALDNMEASNVRNKTDCVAMAMDYNMVDEGLYEK